MCFYIYIYYKYLDSKHVQVAYFLFLQGMSRMSKPRIIPNRNLNPGERAVIIAKDLVYLQSSLYR